MKRMSQGTTPTEIVSLVLAVVLLAGCGPAAEDRLPAAIALQAAERFADSVPLLRGHLEEHPDDAQASFLLGRALVETGEPTAAAWPLEKAARDPEFAVPAGLVLARALTASRNALAAVEVVDRVLVAAPDAEEAYRLRAIAHAMAGGHEASLRDADRLLALAPEDPEALVLRASALIALERRTEAEAALQQVERFADVTAGTAVQACVARAVLAHGAKDEAAAESILLECSERYPGSTLR